MGCGGQVEGGRSWGVWDRWRGVAGRTGGEVEGGVWGTGGGGQVKVGGGGR